MYDTTDESLLGKTFELCKKYEALFSRTVETSDVSRINKIGDGAVEVDPETAELLKTALEYSERTGGKFDVKMCIRDRTR